MAVGAVVALYGVCSLYNWFATILGNIRFRPQPQSPPAADAAPPTHPSKLTLPTFWISEPAAWFALAEAKFRTSNITSVPRMYALFFHRLSILERATDHKCIKECSYLQKKEIWVGSNVMGL